MAVVYLVSGLTTALVDRRRGSMALEQTEGLSSVLVITGAGLDWMGRGLIPDARLRQAEDLVEL